MKNYKIILSVILILAVALSFGACKGNGSGKKKAESSTVDQVDAVEGDTPQTPDGAVPEDAQVPGGGAVPGAGNVPTTKGNSSGNNSSGKTNQKTTKKSEKKKDTKKPSAPAAVKSIKATKVTTTSITLEWSKVKCSAYQVYISKDGYNWNYESKELKKNTISISNLTSYTDYYFTVRAFNRHDAGAVASAWCKPVKVTTKADSSTRNIKVNVELPIKGSQSDTVIIYVNDKKVDEHSVKMNGSTYSFTTPKKYKGVVTIKAQLKTEKVKASVKTDKAQANLSLKGVGINNVDGGRD